MAKTIKIKIGMDQHVMVKSTEDKRSCAHCSMRSICFNMGQVGNEVLCDALLREIYDSPFDFSPYGGHFELKK